MKRAVCVRKRAVFISFLPLVTKNIKIETTAEKKDIYILDALEVS